MSKVRYERRQSRSLVPRFEVEARSLDTRKAGLAIDLWRSKKMKAPDYVPITTKELKRMNRLEAIRNAVEKPKYGTYSAEQIEVLPPAPNQRQHTPIRQHRRHRKGVMS